MTEPVQPNDKKKRASKRYPYSQIAKTEINGQGFELQLLNISKTGIQFAARTRVPASQPLRIHWVDSKFGNFDPTFMIAREIHQPESKDFTYFYGAQYYSLSSEMKDKLLVLLKTFKETTYQEIVKNVEKITPAYLLDAINQGSSFLKKLLLQENPNVYFDTIISDIPKYEKDSFESTDEASALIQLLATQNFHCRVLRAMAPVTAGIIEMHHTYFQAVSDSLERIISVENKVEIGAKVIQEGSLSAEEKKQLQQHFNESSNRLFYSKQAMLQGVAEIFETEVTTNDSTNLLEKIKSEHDKLVSFQSGTNAEAVTYARRSKKPDEFSKVDVIADLAPLSEKKPNYLLFFMIFFLIVVVVSYGFMFFDNRQKQSTLEEEMGIDVNILSFERLGAQIDIEFSAKEWANVPEEKKEVIFQKVTDYLTKSKPFRSAVIMDDDNKLIQIIHERRTQQ